MECILKRRNVQRVREKPLKVAVRQWQ